MATFEKQVWLWDWEIDAPLMRRIVFETKKVELVKRRAGEWWTAESTEELGYFASEDAAVADVRDALRNHVQEAKGVVAKREKRLAEFGARFPETQGRGE